MRLCCDGTVSTVLSPLRRLKLCALAFLHVSSGDAHAPLRDVTVAVAMCVVSTQTRKQKLIAVDDMFENPLVLLAHIVTPSAVFSVALALFIDVPQMVTSSPNDDVVDGVQWTPSAIVELSIFVCVGGLTAFFLIVAEVKLVQLTSSVTLGVFGAIKEVCQIALAVIVFKDALSFLNTTGLFLTILSTEM